MTDKEKSLGWLMFFDTVVCEVFKMVDDAREAAGGHPEYYADLLADIHQLVEEVLPLTTVERE